MTTTSVTRKGQRVQWRASVPRLVAAVVLAAASSAVAAKSRIVNTPTNALASQVLHDLVSTSLGRTLPALHWDFYLIDDYDISASSDDAGKIFVTTGMAGWYLGQSRGVWAAVLGHEIGHALIAHPASWPAFEAALSRLERDAGVGTNAQPSRELFGYSSNAQFNVRSPKDREYAADEIALMLMAEAGYHPDYAVTLDRWMTGGPGDAASLVGFLAVHPPWRDREARAQEEEPAALTVFRSRWPDAAKSPGGLAPPRGKLGRVTVAESDGRQELTIQAPVTVEKATGISLRVAAVFLAGRKRVQSRLPNLRTPDGSLAVNDAFDGSTAGSREVTLKVPLAAMETATRKLRLVVFFVAGDIVLDVAYVPVKLGKLPGSREPAGARLIESASPAPDRRCRHFHLIRSPGRPRPPGRLLRG